MYIYIYTCTYIHIYTHMHNIPAEAAVDHRAMTLPPTRPPTLTHPRPPHTHTRTRPPTQRIFDRQGIAVQHLHWFCRQLGPASCRHRVPPDLRRRLRRSTNACGYVVVVMLHNRVPPDLRRRLRPARPECVYMHACMHACMHTYIHTCIHTHTRTGDCGELTGKAP